MKIGKDDHFQGYSMEQIKEHIQYGDQETKNQFRGFKRDIALTNKVATQLFTHNKELVGNWKKAGDHYVSFVKRIMLQIKDGVYKVEQLGQIEALDNGTRGLARTFQMHLYDIKGNILDVSEEHLNRYYNM